MIVLFLSVMTIYFAFRYAELSCGLFGNREDEVDDSSHYASEKGRRDHPTFAIVFFAAALQFLDSLLEHAQTGFSRGASESEVFA